ncbi:MAG: hypothetical protein EA343_17500 [Nodularia sp. (in: Bacteria)]|nr:MAG: hypothetical protein EA343_17500 [Nodularia sp. (in: cyanobacteria)]
MLMKHGKERNQKLLSTNFFDTSIQPQKLTTNIWFIQEDKIVQDKNWLTEKTPENLDLSYGLSEISSHYTIDNFVAILRFLRKHQNMIEVLLEANHEIRKYFSLEKLRLKLYIDPESSQWEYLILSICASPDSVDEALDKLDQFENNWWSDASFGVATNICINLEFDEI